MVGANPYGGNRCVHCSGLITVDGDERVCMNCGRRQWLGELLRASDPTWHALMGKLKREDRHG